MDTEEKKKEIERMVTLTGRNVNMIDGITFTSNMDGFVTNVAGHAQREAMGDYAVLKLNTKGIKDVIVSSDIEIPAKANTMRFSYKFLISDKGGLLEAFIEDIPIFYIYSEDYKIDKSVNNKNFEDWRHSMWIPLDGITGQKISLSFRLTNFNEMTENKYNVVVIDDIYFAEIK